MRKQVIVGLSGGVDSAVAALLLKRAGYKVIGATIDTGYLSCDNAREVADALGIELVVIDARDRFKNEVICPFAAEYLEARTPNPCVLCNPGIKWGLLLELADERGISQIATGHYSRVKQLENGRLSIQKAPWKDQSYVLYGLSQDALSRTLMPLCGYTKAEVRALAEAAKLPCASAGDSQEICFVPDKDYAAFIQKSFEKEALAGLKLGHFVDKNGNILGEHKGLLHYTIGQRKGLGIALGSPRFVNELRPETNEIVLGTDEECFGMALRAANTRFMGISEEELTDGFPCFAKIRYAHEPQACRVFRDGDDLRAEFAEPVRAITPGQAVVFYVDDYVAFGATITEAL